MAQQHFRNAYPHPLTIAEQIAHAQRGAAMTADVLRLLEKLRSFLMLLEGLEGIHDQPRDLLRSYVTQIGVATKQAREGTPPIASEQDLWARGHEYRVWVYEDGTAALDKPDGREYLDQDQARYLLRAIAYTPCINTKAEKVAVKP